MLTVDAPLVEAADALRRGRRRVSDYLNEILDRADAIGPTLRALLPESGRRERVLAEARELTRRNPVDQVRPPLFGVPIGVKDLISVAGLPMRCGSALPPEIFEVFESPVVTGLRAQGAIVLGTTTMDEFGYSEPSSARNPVHVSHTPGGSSAGSAAGVAAGLFPLGLGTQTSRSIVGPAAFCGVVGFKPSYDRVPMTGVVCCAPSLDVLGLFTQDAAGMALAASLVIPGWRPDPPGKLPRLGVPDGAFLEPVSGEPRRVFDSQLESLRWAGYDLDHVLFYAREDLKRLHRQAVALLHGEIARVHGAWFGEYASLYRPATVRAIEKGREVKDDDLVHAREGQILIRDGLNALMDEHGIDFWICPSSNGPAPRGDRPTGYGAMTALWSYAGLPCVSLPGATTETGMPLGLQLVGRYGSDESLLDCARYVQRKLVG